MPVRAEQPASYYDAIYAKGYDTARYHRLYAKILSHLKNFPSPPRILEIGCGTGDLARLLIENGFRHYFGFDFSPEGVKQTLSKLEPLVGKDAVARYAAQKDAYSLASINSSYDYTAVVALEVFEHLDDLRVVEQIRLGTRVLFSVPNFDDLSHVRTYPDTNFISERYARYLHIIQIDQIVHESDPGRIIFLVYAIRTV